VDMELVVVVFMWTKGSLPLMETGLARPLDEEKSLGKFRNVITKCVILFICLWEGTYPTLADKIVQKFHFFFFCKATDQYRGQFAKMAGFLAATTLSVHSVHRFGHSIWTLHTNTQIPRLNLCSPSHHPPRLKRSFSAGPLGAFDCHGSLFCENVQNAV
jgi:hypothetical protein